MSDHYDWNGRPMSATDWADASPAPVAQHRVGRSIVSTVWTGSDYRPAPVGPPAVFETLVFGGQLAGKKEWTANEPAARTAHARMVARVERTEEVPATAWGYEEEP